MPVLPEGDMYEPGVLHVRISRAGRRDGLWRFRPEVCMRARDVFRRSTTKEKATLVGLVATVVFFATALWFLRGL